MKRLPFSQVSVLFMSDHCGCKLWSKLESINGALVFCPVQAFLQLLFSLSPNANASEVHCNCGDPMYNDLIFIIYQLQIYQVGNMLLIESARKGALCGAIFRF